MALFLKPLMVQIADHRTPVARLRSQEASEIPHCLFLVIFSLLVIWVLFHNLGEAALFEPDEGRNAEIAREFLLIPDWVTPHYNFIPRLDKPACFFWLVAFSYKLFGVSEWSARLPSTLASLATVVIIFIIVRSFIGYWEALWSSLVLVTSVEYILLSRLVILDMTLTFFITLSLCAFYWGNRAIEKPAKRVFYLLMYGAMGIAALIKGPIGLALPATVIFFYVLVARKWFLLVDIRPFLGLIVLLLIITPWYAAAELRNPGYLRYFLLEENVLRFLTSRFHRSGSWYTFIAVLAVGSLPWTSFIPVILGDLWKKLPRDETLFLSVWTAVPLLIVTLSRSKLPHYILPTFPPFAALVGRVVVEHLKDPWQQRRWLFSLPWLALMLVFLSLTVILTWPDLFSNQVRDSFALFSRLIPRGLTYGALPVFIVFTLISWKARWQRRLYLIYFTGSLIFLICVGQLTTSVSSARSSKELAEKSSRFIHAGDLVVIYHAYLSSLVFYLHLDHPAWFVWSGTKGAVMGSSYVAEFHPQPLAGFERLLFTYEEFSKVWSQSNRRLLLFAHSSDLPRLVKDGPMRPRTLLQVGDVVLISNQEPRG